MKFIFYILLFITCCAGSFNNTVNNPLNDQFKREPVIRLTEFDLSANSYYTLYISVEDNIYFDLQYENEIVLNRAEYRYQTSHQLTNKLFYKNFPFFFNKSTDPFLELDIPPPPFFSWVIFQFSLWNTYLSVLFIKHFSMTWASLIKSQNNLSFHFNCNETYQKKK